MNRIHPAVVVTVVFLAAITFGLLWLEVIVETLKGSAI